MGIPVRLDLELLGRMSGTGLDLQEVCGRHGGRNGIRDGGKNGGEVMGSPGMISVK